MDRKRHLRTLREHEARRALRYFPEEGRVLEIGAGSGWQSKMFDELGYDVSAIDLATSHYLEDAVFPVKTYDGYRIPFADDSFDLVFSSNALEHIAHIAEFQSEIRRVLAPGGYAVHLMPSASWCFWNNLTYYWAIPGKLFSRLRAGRRPAAAYEDPAFWGDLEAETRLENMDLVDFAEFVQDDDETSATPRPEFVAGLRERLRGFQKFYPPRHGEVGNSFSEMYWFSRRRWTRLFEREGFRVLGCHPNHLLYTGHYAFGDALSIPARDRLSRFLGSSCLIYVVEPLDP